MQIHVIVKDKRLTEKRYDKFTPINGSLRKEVLISKIVCDNLFKLNLKQKINNVFFLSP